MKKLLLSALLLFATLSTFAFEDGAWYTLSIGSKSLIIENASMKNGAKVVIWTNTNVPAQMWTVETDDEGVQHLYTAYLGNYLCAATSPKEGVKIVARTSSSKNRLGSWILKPVEGKDDTYTIETTDGTAVLAVENTNNGTQPALVSKEAPTGKYEWKITMYDGNVSTSYDENARDQIVNGFMNHYYHNASVGHVLGNGGVWGDAEMIESLLDGFETTGDKAYQTYTAELLNNLFDRLGKDWTREGQGWPRSNEYNDDITWMCLALMRSYKYFKNSTHLTVARDNFDKMWARAYQPGGTLRWSQGASDHGSNSCINCPAIIAACYLYEITGEEDYLTKAKNLWEAQYNTLCDKNDGHVWDSGEWNSNFTVFTTGNYWGSTYNQGTMLGACVKLYNITGDEKYKNYADKVYNWSYNSLTANTTDSPRIINACQTATGDLCGFKGILVRYVRLYAEEFGKEEPLQWLEKNAWYGLQNANKDGVIWSKWITKTSDDYKSKEGNETKDFNNDAFGSSTIISCALNAHVNRVFTKDAYSNIECEMMDDAKWLQLSTSSADDATLVTTRATNGAWICFKNVDFGTEGANSLILRVKGGATASLAVYIDHVSEENIIAKTSADELQNIWESILLPTSKTITGNHKVFVGSTGSTGLYFHNLVFLNETADGIDNINVENSTSNSLIYNIAGQRLDAPQKGLNIIGGKKVLVK